MADEPEQPKKTEAPPPPPEPPKPAEPAPEPASGPSSAPEPAAEPAPEGPSSEDPGPGDAPEEDEKTEPPKRRRRRKYTYKVLLFEKYDLSEVEVHDAGLARYINLDPIVVPHTGGRYANRPFGKQRVNIVERLINSMMRTEDFTGKKSKALRVVRGAFERIEAKTKQNPVQMFVNALENAAPREGVTRLRFGGISVPRAVDIAPVRRLDFALRSIAQGAVQASFSSAKSGRGKSIEQCLADEILAAANGDMNSQSIQKKDELERVAASAR